MANKRAYLMIFFLIIVFPFLLGGCDDPDKKCDECKDDAQAQQTACLENNVEADCPVRDCTQICGAS